jgi:putative hydrolase of the HAD superfamily
MSDDPFSPPDPALVAHVRARSHPLAPRPTAETPSPGLPEGLRAVVFDIYGTLFISASGDISLAVREDRTPAITAALATAGFRIEQPARDWAGRFFKALEHFRTRRANQGVRHPEVRIEEVWAALVDGARGDGWLSGSGNLRLAIVDHECRVNPGWPMPGLAAALDHLKASAIPVGIVSNAQFYTPLLFPALLGRPLADWGFAPDLCVWSWRERVGKPDRHLYQLLAAALARRGIQPEQALYLGNDLRNDVWPAQACGFHTALFAGDARSLRWRRDDPDCAGITPEHVITDLAQLRQYRP